MKLINTAIPMLMLATAALQAESLKDAVSHALQTHPKIKIAEQRLNIAEESLTEVESERKPTVDLRWATGREESENSSVSASGDQHRRLTRFESSLTLRQMLYSGKSVKSRIIQNEAQVQGSRFDLIDQSQQVALSASEAYLEVLKSNELIRLAQENVAQHKDVLEKVEARFKENIGQEADVTQVKGRLALAEAQLERELANQESAHEDYLEAVGRKPAGLVNSSSIGPKLPTSLGIAKQKAFTTHPLLKSNDTAIESAEAGIEVQTAKFRPSIDLELTANESDNLNGVTGNNDSYSAMIVFNWNLFKGGADRAAKRRSISELALQKELKGDLKRQVGKNLANSWFARKATLVELNYFIKHEAAAKTTVEAYQEQLENSKRTLFDLLNAKDELYRASVRVVNATFANELGAYDILAKMGNLTDTLRKTTSTATKKMK